MIILLVFRKYGFILFKSMINRACTANEITCDTTRNSHMLCISVIILAKTTFLYVWKNEDKKSRTCRYTVRDFLNFIIQLLTVDF